MSWNLNFHVGLIGPMKCEIKRLQIEVNFQDLEPSDKKQYGSRLQVHSDRS
jgi:hypothetical protein